MLTYSLHSRDKLNVANLLVGSTTKAHTRKLSSVGAFLVAENAAFSLRNHRRLQRLLFCRSCQELTCKVLLPVGSVTYVVC